MKHLYNKAKKHLKIVPKHVLPKFHLKIKSVKMPRIHLTKGNRKTHVKFNISKFYHRIHKARFSIKKFDKSIEKHKLNLKSTHLKKAKKQVKANRKVHKCCSIKKLTKLKVHKKIHKPVKKPLTKVHLKKIVKKIAIKAKKYHTKLIKVFQAVQIIRRISSITIKIHKKKKL